MGQMTAGDQIRAYFDRVGRASLKLPDGWFGRPMDNLHALTGVRAENDVLVVELDDRHALSFSGPVEVSDEGGLLSVRGFSSAEWTTSGWGSQATTTVRAFEGGLVEFHA